MNNMGKGIGVVIFGAVLSVAGLIIAGVNAKNAYDDYKSYDKFKTGHIDLVENTKLSIEADAGVVTVHHSTTTTSYVDYKVFNFYDVKYDESENEIKMKRNWKFWFVWFPNNTSTMDIYLTDKDYDAYLELNAGKLIVEDDFKFNSLTIDVSAGTLNTGNFTVNNDLNVKISAGTINLGNVVANGAAYLKESAGTVDVKYLEAKSVETKLSAGDMDIKVKSDNIKFGLSAGDLDMTIVGKQEDYKTTIKKSAGSCNIDNNLSGSKTLDGKLSAGSATIKFVEE